MAKPSTVGATLPPPQAPQPLPFVNEPLSDFSQADVREAMEAAIHSVSGQLGREYSMVIEGRNHSSRNQMMSFNPSRKNQVIGKISMASAADVDLAISSAKRILRIWSKVAIDQRIEIIDSITAMLRERRLELAAWEVFECGKPWAEADADIAEAIDFCRYYAQQAKELMTPREVDIAGEENTYFFKPRGMAAIIAPWNFPLAILCGMTIAALATGNLVIIKPSEESTVVAAKFMQILRECGLPEGVVSFLPGPGDVVGAALVAHPGVDVIAFTGSRDVGLEINRIASETDPRQTGVKKVIAEMGGKNAIIVDDDADLDEAVQGVVQSALGYSGQKCSACSRVLVMKSIYQNFSKRLLAAIRSLKIGPADAPGTTVGPLISEEAVERMKRYIEIGKAEARLVLECPLEPELKDAGYFVAPHVFADVPPTSRLAQEEIFGPIISIIPVKDLDEAINIANGTEYALTAGVFSRSPANLRRCTQELIAGNLYLNRGTTGALVHRQPFGGYRFSGIGSKAGGADYLLQFVVPVNVTENSMRRGFAPASESEG